MLPAALTLPGVDTLFNATVLAMMLLPTMLPLALIPVLPLSKIAILVRSFCVCIYRRVWVTQYWIKFEQATPV